MSRASLKAFIASIINPNGANEISGQDGQDAHNAAIDQLYNLADDNIGSINGIPTIQSADIGKFLIVNGDNDIAVSSEVPYTNAQIDTAIAAAIAGVTSDSLSKYFTNALRTPSNSSNSFTVNSTGEGKTAYTSYPRALLLTFTNAIGTPTTGATLKIDSLSTVTLKDSEGEDLQNVVEGCYWAIKDPSGNYRLQSVGGGAGHTIQDEGVDLPQRAKLNFIGATVTDDAGNDATNVEYGFSNYIETTFTNQSSVIVTHNIGKYPVVQVLNDSNEVIVAYSITHNTVNDYTVTFTGNKTGTILTTSGAPFSLSGGAVDSVNGETGVVVVDLQSATDEGNTTTSGLNALNFNGVALTTVGDGNSYLANDGTYKSIGGGAEILKATIPKADLDLAWISNTYYTYTKTVAGAEVGDCVNVGLTEALMAEIAAQNVGIDALEGTVSAIDTVKVYLRVTGYITIPAGGDILITVAS